MTDHRIVFYASAHRAPDVYRRSYVPVFTETHTARAWLDTMLHGRDYTRDGDTITFEPAPGMPITIRCEQLDEVLRASKPNAPIGGDHGKWILRFKFGTWDEVHTRDEPVDDGETSPTQRAPKVERAPRAQRPDGFVTITELCATWNVLPMIARAALRASGRVKPAFGWAFAPNEVAAIKKLVVTA